MRVEPRLLQAGTLANAEFVLFVDHDQAEPGELTSSCTMA